MKKNCPNIHCSSHQNTPLIVKDGFYKRSCDSRKIQRFKCKICHRKFSNATDKLEFRQQKRRENPLIFKLLASSVSLRRTAKILNLSRGTVVRRLYYFGEKSRLQNETFKKKYLKNQVTHMQIDDLVTKENSKLKPISVSIAVDGDRRFILGCEVSSLRAFGHLAKRGREKYPERKNTHKEGLTNLFESLKDIMNNNNDYLTIRSDEHRFYPEYIQNYFPNSIHETYKNEKGCIAGQGELKKVSFDPLFVINHTCAMLRANINRLVRKTWCTTKDPQRLRDHLDLFINFYNQEILKILSLVPI